MVYFTTPIETADDIALGQINIFLRRKTKAFSENRVHVWGHFAIHPEGTLFNPSYSTLWNRNNLIFPGKHNIQPACSFSQIPHCIFCYLLFMGVLYIFSSF